MARERRMTRRQFLIAYGRWAILFVPLFVMTFWLDNPRQRAVARIGILLVVGLDLFLVPVIARRLPKSLDDDG
jgi:uncharacterized membrane protein YhaH (DUF805 family)